MGGDFVASDEARVDTYRIGDGGCLQMDQSSRIRNEVPVIFSFSAALEQLR